MRGPAAQHPPEALNDRGFMPKAPKRYIPEESGVNLTEGCFRLAMQNRDANTTRDDTSTQKVYLLRHMVCCVSVHVSLKDSQIVLLILRDQTLVRRWIAEMYLFGALGKNPQCAILHSTPAGGALSSWATAPTCTLKEHAMADSAADGL